MSIISKTWNLLEKMKYKLENSPGMTFATLEVQDSAKGPVYNLQWEDEEMYQASKQVLTYEKELSTLIKRMPEPTLLFQVRHPQFQELVQFRIDVENIIFKLASQTKGTAPYTKGVTGSLTCDCKEWVSRNLDEGNMNKFICRNDCIFWEEKHRVNPTPNPTTGTPHQYVGTSQTVNADLAPPRYHPRIGFVVEFDYILHMPGHFDNVRVVYGIYRNGLVVDPPRAVDWRDIKIKAFERDRYGYAVFNIKHLIKDIIAYSGTWIIFEIQVNLNKKVSAADKAGAGGYQSHTSETPTLGYELYRFWGEEEKDDTDVVFYDESQESNKFVAYAWTMAELFCNEDELKDGIWKLPIYKPPTNLESTPYDFSLGVIRFYDPDLYIRISYPDDQTDIEWSPYFANLYTVPRLHQFTCREAYMDPEEKEPDMFDPDSKVEGMAVALHYIEGLIPSTLIRVALTVQLGKWIAKDEGGRLCFWAGKGHKHFLIEEMEEERKKEQMAKEEQEIDPIHGGDDDDSDDDEVGEDGKKKKKKKKRRKKKKKKQKGPSPEEIAKKTQRDMDRQFYGDDTMFLDEKHTWYQDFYSLFWNKWYKENNRNLYLLIQVLQLKDGITPSNANVTKQLLAREYDLIGYGTEQLTFGDGKVTYGEFEVPLYKPPIYVWEFEQIKMTPLKIRISIDKPNLDLPPLKPEPRTELDKKLKPCLNLLKKKLKAMKKGGLKKVALQ